jgi:hypothetical protein
LRAWSVTVDRVGNYDGQVDRIPRDRELGSAETCEIEEITHEPLEPVRFCSDDAARLTRGHRALLDRLGVAADRCQRRLELVTG